MILRMYSGQDALKIQKILKWQQPRAPFDWHGPYQARVNHIIVPNLMLLGKIFPAFSLISIIDSAHLKATFEPGLTQADGRYNCVLKYCSPLLTGMIGKNVNRSCYIFRTAGLGFFFYLTVLYIKYNNVFQSGRLIAGAHYPE